MGILVNPVMEMSYLILHLLEILQIMNVMMGSNVLVMNDELASHLAYGQELCLNVDVSIIIP